MDKRLDYLDYVAAQPQPGIAVIQDLDDVVGFGAFWGEVQSNIHKALGCLGVVTNGSIRDIPLIAPGFQMLAGSLAPSHAYVHVVDFGGNVNIHGMAVQERRPHPRRPARRRRGAAQHHRRHEGRGAEARRQGGADHRGGEIRQGRRGDQGGDEVSLVRARVPLRPVAGREHRRGSPAASAPRPRRADAGLRAS